MKKGWFLKKFPIPSHPAAIFRRWNFPTKSCFSQTCIIQKNPANVTEFFIMTDTSGLCSSLRSLKFVFLQKVADLTLVLLLTFRGITSFVTLHFAAGLLSPSVVRLYNVFANLFCIHRACFRIVDD